MLSVFDGQGYLADGAAFWPALWPALVATILGVVLGLPIALWLNRLALRQASHREESDRQEALSRAARALRESITWNGEKAAKMNTEVTNGSLAVDTPLETERWEAIKPEFIRLARDPGLRGRVAFFFDQVRRCAALSDRLFDFRLGPASAVNHAEQVERAIRSELEERLAALSLEAQELDLLLQKLELPAAVARA